MTQNKGFAVIKYLSVFGMLLSLYLLYEQHLEKPVGICNINQIVTCEAIVTGSVSNVLGIPTPLYGLVGYALIFIGAWYRKKALTLGVASFGLFFCLGIGYVELFQLKNICPICVLCELTMVSIFILAYRLRGMGSEEIPAPQA